MMGFNAGNIEAKKCLMLHCIMFRFMASTLLVPSSDSTIHTVTFLFRKECNELVVIPYLILSVMVPLQLLVTAI